MCRAWISPLLAAVLLPGVMAGHAACSGAPSQSQAAESAAPGAHRSDTVDDCAPSPGRPAPEPLARVYDGLASRARCEREVFTLMEGVARSLGVGCDHCHVEGDYRADTKQKQVANWMARELVPRLVRRADGGEVWCSDCHAASGRGVAKILGTPRSEPWAIEWMTAHLASDFARIDGKRLQCSSCHGAALGAPGFRRQLILGDGLGALPSRRAPAEPVAPDAGAPLDGPGGAAGEAGNGP